MVNTEYFLFVILATLHFICPSKLDGLCTYAMLLLSLCVCVCVFVCVFVCVVPRFSCVTQNKLKVLQSVTVSQAANAVR